MLILAYPIFSPSALAHEQKELSIILGEEGPIPDSIANGVLVETDYLFFINVDKRENSSHRIQIDADNDGIFDGSDDLATQWLQSSCATDENGSKMENDCMVNQFFLLAPENGLLPGNISMRHQIRIDSETTNNLFYVNFGPDIHSPDQDATQTINTTENPSSDYDGILAFILVISVIGALVTSQKLSQLDEEE